MSPLLARHYRTGAPVRVVLETARFAAFEAASVPDPGALPWIAPGLVDAQVNGFGGVDFNRLPLDEAAWRRADDALARCGATRYLITLITHGADETVALLGRLRALRELHPGGCLGFHLEGPFLNPDPGTRGAHDPAKMVAPDVALFARFQEAAGDAVRLVTLAPEVAPDKAFPFIARLRALGIRASIGHSLAMGETVRLAADAGATAWTHLGNAAPRQADKFENVILHALAEDRLCGFLIPDGLHVPPTAFRALARALEAESRLLLTTDAMAGAGAPAGTAASTLGAAAVDLLPDGRAVLPGTGKLAGSTLIPCDGVFRAARMAGLPWSEMWNAFSTGPAAWLGLEQGGGLGIGRPADFCLLEETGAGEDPRLLAAWRDGAPVWERQG